MFAEKVRELLKNRSNIMAIMFCIAGVMFNLLLNYVVTRFKLPLYLDTVGTVAIAGMGGYLPGVLVGFITNIMKSLYNEESMYYGVLNVLIALFAALFIRRGWHKRTSGKVAMILLFSFIGGGLGALIPWFMNGMVFDGEFLLEPLLETGMFSREVAYFLSSVILEVPDKIISVTASLIIIKLIPVKFYPGFSLHMWMQNPVDSDDRTGRGDTKVRCISLRMKTLLVFGFSLTTVSIIGIVLSVQVFRKNMLDENKWIVYSAVNQAQDTSDGAYDYKEIPDDEEFSVISEGAVYDSSGRQIYYAVPKVDMHKIDVSVQKFLTEIISLFLANFILLGVFTVWLTRYHVLIPINSIVKCMDEISHTSEAGSEMEEGLKRLRSLGIHTGDELENLYISLCNMTKNQAEHMRSIKRLSDATMRMQDGLIITMADMVENRDSDTGAHIQKTAAYVKIIAEGLKKKGYYPEKLTPKFMSDVVRSAPLHDIGKIFIPDKVLNKPGKLTDEEYEIMKTHTTAGKRIVENAIDIVEGDNYLKEARNMAAYHHERWDGKGYPEGIHGEVIPLSARIMAVADVFDALTSERVYKAAFTLDEALKILEEGKGTQFDSKCVEAFMDSLPEVKVILMKYRSAAQGGI